MQEGSLTTPVFVKTQVDMPWPDHRVFYLLAGDGLYLCRNHPFFKSSVPARQFPRELSWHNTSLTVRYPKIPPRALGQILAYFIHLGKRYDAEAIVLLAWDEPRRRIRIVVPDQVATVGCNWRKETWAVGVEYEVPKNLPGDWTLFGDVHSHVDGAAFASYVDRDDECHRPGLHIIIGRVFDKNPDFVAQSVVDGTRFNLKQAHVIEGYRGASRRFPRSWLDRIQIKWLGQDPPPGTLQPAEAWRVDSAARSGNSKSQQKQAQHSIDERKNLS